jgi:subtilisin family serine protease
VNIFSGTANVNSSSPAGYLAVIDQQYLFDVVNHSWGAFPTYINDTSQITIATLAGFARAATEGRDGLGTIVVKAAGNSADSANGDAMNATRHAIIVGAHDWEGDASWYTNRGPNLLVSAPTSGNTPEGDLRIVTTDRMGGEGYAPDDYTWTDSTGFGGTSSAAPTVAGVVALMLDANPNLGWRDVQTILAYSAHGLGSYDGPLDNPDENVPVDENGDGIVDYFATLPVEYDTWSYNGADNWNGGGLHYSNDYGYGGVDAYNAVRMAEVWSLFETAQTSTNEVVEDTLARVDTAGDPSLSYNAHGFNGEPDTVSATWTYTGAPMEIE